MTKQRRPLIAVIGDAGSKVDSQSYKLAQATGTHLINHGYRIMTGGLGGIMEAACKGAQDSQNYAEGDTIGLLPGHDPNAANEYIDVAVPTGFDVARNIIVGHADAVVAIGGGAGTLSEMANAWMLKRLIIALRVDGWSGKLADTRIDERTRYKDIPDDRVYGANTPQEVITLLKDLLPSYQGNHQGITRR
ncbi:TIGR00725 family protein [Myxococcota bacterium]|nr:TIGR00725 family protein [Myxococcota bacterium]